MLGTGERTVKESVSLCPKGSDLGDKTGGYTGPVLTKRLALFRCWVNVHGVDE